MNYGKDPQLCTMSDAEEGFRTADLARKYVSSAVRALESVGMEVEP